MIFTLPSGCIKVSIWEWRPVFDGFFDSRNPRCWGLKAGPLVLEYIPDKGDLHAE
jgi:hypothetical protein